MALIVIGALPAMAVPASRPMNCPSDASGVFMLSIGCVLARPRQRMEDIMPAMGGAVAEGGANAV